MPEISISKVKIQDINIQFDHRNIVQLSIQWLKANEYNKTHGVRYFDDRVINSAANFPY
jgi:hypothetical protein